MKRSFLVLLVSMQGLAGCIDHRGFYPDPEAQGLRVTLAASGLSVEALAFDPGAALPVGPGQAALAYELRDRAGSVLASGRVADPRSRHAEWLGVGSMQGEALEPQDASFVVSLPGEAGSLLVSEDGPDGPVELGRVAVEAASPEARAVGLSDDDRAILMPIVLGGPQDRSVDLLFVPEGYTTAELPLFDQEVRALVDGLAARPDWGRHWRRFNVWVLYVSSDESGVDAASAARDTAFDLELVPAAGNRGEITRCADHACWERLTRLRARARADYVIVMANTPRAFRATGGGGFVFMPPRQDAGIIAHELGHAVIGLQDEYDEGRACGSSVLPVPNVSFTTERWLVPWANLIDPATPLPTPESSNAIGAYQGAWWCHDAFRPAPTCLMRDARSPACPVCQGAIDGFMALLDPPLPGSTLH